MDEVTRRPVDLYVYRRQDHEPLDAEGLAWLADQLCSDTRVHPDRTMASGWITTQAAYEFPALLDALATARAETAALQEEVGRLRAFAQYVEETCDDEHYVRKARYATSVGGQQ